MNMSTGLASLGLDYGPKCVTYSISKTALNMLVRTALYFPIPRCNMALWTNRATRRLTSRPRCGRT